MSTKTSSPVKLYCFGLSRRTFIIIASVSTFLCAAGIALGVYFGVYYDKNGSSSGTSMPYISPPVKAATPSSLKGTRRLIGLGSSFAMIKQHRQLTLSPTGIQSRFFSGGPTDLFNILQGLDYRIQGINQRISSNFAGCLQNDPISYTITTWGTPQTFYVQCSEQFSGGSGFDQFGISNGVFYIYTRGGDSIVAAKQNITSQETWVW